MDGPVNLEERLGDLVRTAAEHRMWELGLTITQVGEYSGVSTRDIGRWFRGNLSMSTARASRILRTLGLDVLPAPVEDDDQNGIESPSE